MENVNMSTAVELVTPSIASEILKNNNGNRNIRRSVVEHYAKEMKNGSWQLTHQGVAISVDGELLDGQHRLSAVVKSGVSVKMLVTRGCEREQFRMMDVGLSRNAEDTVGVKRTPASLINNAFRNYKMISSGYTRLTHSEVREIYDENKDIIDMLSSVKTRGVTANVLLGAWRYISEGGDFQKVKDFSKFMRYGVSENVDRVLIYAGMKFARNEDRLTNKIDSSVIMYKALKSDGSKSHVKVGSNDRIEMSEFCKGIVSEVF